MLKQKGDTCTFDIPEHYQMFSCIQTPRDISSYYGPDIVKYRLAHFLERELAEYFACDVLNYEDKKIVVTRDTVTADLDVTQYLLNRMGWKHELITRIFTSVNNISSVIEELVDDALVIYNVGKFTIMARSPESRVVLSIALNEYVIDQPIVIP